MSLANCGLKFFIYFLIIIELNRVQSDGNILGFVKDITNGLVNDVASVLQDPMCQMKTNEIVEHYGFKPEIHEVITKTGYKLTVFRVNDKNTAPTLGPVVLWHGFLLSSDDFCINMPYQGLAYFLVKEGYDVWIPNAQGNCYSRKHVTRDPDDPSSGFWNFSWDDIGRTNIPAVMEHINNCTNQSTMYMIAHSQGVSSMLTFFSERPEFNKNITAMSFMEPAGFMKHSDICKFGTIEPALKLMKNMEFIPKGVLNNGFGLVCQSFGSPICASFAKKIIFGQSKSETNYTMVPIYLCHAPAGCAVNQLLHFLQGCKYGIFGPYLNGTNVSKNFKLEQVTAPIIIHHSTADETADPTDVKRLASELTGSSDLRVVEIQDLTHIDPLWGINAHEIIYQAILDFFKKHRK